MTALPSISSLPSLPTERRAHILDTLFEPCTQLHTLSVATLHDNAFPDYASLVSAISDQLTFLLNSSSTSDSEWLNAILSAHPRLGEKKVDSELSRREQAQLQEGGGGGEKGEELTLLNRQYEERFPGLRYV
jgi:2-oxo-4-hydroxy-4-carboxy--5-ureidoimidazoline (OHCU) decarboxylase